jgi:hypothetical protein
MVSELWWVKPCCRVVEVRSNRGRLRLVAVQVLEGRLEEQDRKTVNSLWQNCRR